MAINILHVDAFTKEKYQGNPAGVVPYARYLSEEDMQGIARELNLSETAFITPLCDEEFYIRFFTPKCEVDICGHGTIASFYALAEKGYIKPILEGRKRVYQENKLGRLAVDIIYEDYQVKKVYMEQAKPRDIGPVSDLKKLCMALGLEEKDLEDFSKGIEARIVSTGLNHILIPVRSQEILNKLRVDMNLLKEVSRENQVVGVYLFHLEKEDSDFVYTRNFSPAIGIYEESGTGTSSGALVYFLTSNNLIINNNILVIQGQAMERISKIECIIDKEKVFVGGEARISMDGIFYI